MLYRIALCGFSESEYRAMHFSFQHPDADEVGEKVGYEVVDDLDEADFAIVDADSKSAIKGIVLAGRVAQAVFVGSGAPRGAPAVLPRPVDPHQILHALGELTTRFGARGHDAPLSRGFDDPDEIIIVEPPLLMDAVTVPTWPPPDSTMVESDPVNFDVDLETPAEVPADPPEPAPAPPPPPAPPKHDARDAKKAAARAAARRARQSHVHTDPGKLEQMRDVLVLDSDRAASAHLGALLELFGFRVHAAFDIAQAADVLARRPLVAAFLDIALNGADHGDGLALLQTIHDLPRLVGHPTPAVLIVTTELQPADRVRAALAGIDAPLIKPVTRGEVARALEDCDVVLPADARRSV